VVAWFRKVDLLLIVCALQGLCYLCIAVDDATIRHKAERISNKQSGTGYPHTRTGNVAVCVVVDQQQQS